MGSAVDLILIDDDALIRTLWKVQAQNKGHRLLTFEDQVDLRKWDIPFETPVYVDLNFNSVKKGLEILKYLSSLGYRKLHLVTGEEISSSERPPYVLAFLNKDYPLD